MKSETKGKPGLMAGPSTHIDWKSGRIEFSVPQDDSSIPTWSLMFSGDWAPPRQYLNSNGGDGLGLYGELLPRLRDSDLLIFNLECVLADDDIAPIVKAGPSIQLPSRAVQSLRDVPFHLACLANNHIFDFGLEGVRRTIDLLNQHHIRTVGAGPTTEEAELPAFFQFGDVRMACVNVAEGEEAKSLDGGPGVASLDLSRLQEHLSDLRSSADVVIVIVHAGREFVPVPSLHIRKCFRKVVDAGADLVVGHHPHVPQGIEIHRGVPIVYSLGNFAFRTSESKYQSRGYLLKATFLGSHLFGLEIIPYAIEDKGLRLLKNLDLEDFLQELELLSSLVGDDERLADIWDAYVDHWLISKGLVKLAVNTAILSGESMTLRSSLIAALHRFEAGGFVNRLARSSILRMIRWLGRRIDKGNSHRARNATASMKRGAAILRNQFDTATHTELHLAGLKRVMDGNFGSASDWAGELVDKWQVFS